MGYLKCKSCGGRYDLEHEESPDDFECCQCGGKLDFYDDQGYKRMYRSVSGKKSNSGMHPLLKILIIIVGGYLIFSFILVPYSFWAESSNPPTISCSMAPSFCKAER